MRELAIFTLLAATAFAHDGAKFEPPDGTVIHGAGQDQTGYDNYTNALALAAGNDSLHPFITKTYTDAWGRYPKQYVDGQLSASGLHTQVVVPLINWLAAQQGLMPEISINFELYSGVFGESWINSGQLDFHLADIALAIKAFPGRCFVRIGYEPNSLHYTIGAPYINAYRHIVEVFRANGVENVAYVWCSGDANGVELAQVGAWFPGDAYVDWVGIDLFLPVDFGPTGPSSYPPSLVAMLALANSWHKPIILSETSAVFDIPPGSGFAAGGISESSPAAAQIYWDTWFGPFFQFIADNPRIKAFNYIDWNWPAHGFPWVDSRIENNPTLVGMIATELAKPKYIHKATSLKFQRPWFQALGANVMEGGAVSIRDANGDPFGTSVAPLVGFFYGGAKIIQPSPNPGYLNYTLGTAALGQFWFLASPYFGPLSPTAASTDGTFRLDFTLPPPGSGLAGTTIFFQAVVQPSGDSNRLTQPYELAIS